MAGHPPGRRRSEIHVRASRLDGVWMGQLHEILRGLEPPPAEVKMVITGATAFLQPARAGHPREVKHATIVVRRRSRGLCKIPHGKR